MASKLTLLERLNLKKFKFRCTECDTIYYRKKKECDVWYDESYYYSALCPTCEEINHVSRWYYNIVGAFRTLPQSVLESIRLFSTRLNAKIELMRMQPVELDPGFIDLSDLETIKTFLKVERYINYQNLKALANKQLYLEDSRLPELYRTCYDAANVFLAQLDSPRLKEHHRTPFKWIQVLEHDLEKIDEMLTNVFMKDEVMFSLFISDVYETLLRWALRSSWHFGPSWENKNLEALTAYLQGGFQSSLEGMEIYNENAEKFVIKATCRENGIYKIICYAKHEWNKVGGYMLFSLDERDFWDEDGANVLDLIKKADHHDENESKEAENDAE